MIAANLLLALLLVSSPAAVLETASIGEVPVTPTPGALIGGVASWYDDGPGHYGAAGPDLREALGGDPAFRGEHVTVCSRGHCTTVVLRDWCACGPRSGKATLIDLSPDAFRDLAPLSRGIIPVALVYGEGPRPTLPPTDTGGKP